MIKIIAIGKNIDFLKNAELEYETRIKHFTKLEITELKEDKSKTPKEIMLKEAKKIKDVIKGQKYIALEIEGQTPTTEKFTDIIKNNTEKNTIFVIGGAYGLDDEIKNKANKLISLSKMTFTHQIARILLLEQIYRAQTIINNRNYHK